MFKIGQMAKCNGSLPATSGDNNDGLSEAAVRGLNSSNSGGQSCVCWQRKDTLEVVKDLAVEHGRLGFTADVGHGLHSLDGVVALGRLT